MAKHTQNTEIHTQNMLEKHNAFTAMQKPEENYRLLEYQKIVKHVPTVT